MPVASLGSKLGGRLLQSPLWGSEGERGFGRFFAKICENIVSSFLETVLRYPPPVYRVYGIISFPETVYSPTFLLWGESLTPGAGSNSHPTP